MKSTTATGSPCTDPPATARPPAASPGRHAGGPARGSARPKGAQNDPAGREGTLGHHGARLSDRSRPDDASTRRTTGLVSATVLRMFAALTRFGGAKRGANGHRHQATPSAVQRLSSQVNGSFSHAQRRPATSRSCLLSSRSQVRVLLGAPTFHPRSGRISSPRLMIFTRLVSDSVPVACPIASG